MNKPICKLKGANMDLDMVTPQEVLASVHHSLLLYDSVAKASLLFVDCEVYLS
jgi:hypothetical protein